MGTGAGCYHFHRMTASLIKDERAFKKRAMKFCRNRINGYNIPNMTDELKKSKYDFLLYLLEKGYVMVCLDARHSDVKVPKNHKADASLSLILNLNFKRPIEVTTEGIFATLAFQGRPHECVIPFDSMWAIFTPAFEEGQVWDESVPPDVDLKGQMKVQTPKTEKKVPIKVLSGELPLSDTPSIGEKAGLSKRDRSHLRVIK